MDALARLMADIVDNRKRAASIGRRARHHIATRYDQKVGPLGAPVIALFSAWAAKCVSDLGSCLCGGAVDCGAAGLREAAACL